MLRQRKAPLLSTNIYISGGLSREVRHNILSSQPHLLTLIVFRALIAAIRCNGRCPCPRCLVEKSDIHKLGQVKDRQTRTKLRTFIGLAITKARDFIYKTGHIINSTFVEGLLFAHSWVPTMVSSFISWISRAKTHVWSEYFCREAQPVQL